MERYEKTIASDSEERVGKNVAFVEKKLIGRVKRVFLRGDEYYTVYTDFFHFKENFYNYIAVELTEQSEIYSVEFGIWFDKLRVYFSKTKLLMGVDELKESFTELSKSFNAQ